MDRDLFTAHALHVAPRVLGARLRVDSKDGPVALRITEVEAYHGVGVPGPYDAGSHSRDRKTERNASMFGPPGHAYVYFTYGMHYALNLVCSPEGTASAVLIRAGRSSRGWNSLRNAVVAHAAATPPNCRAACWLADRAMSPRRWESSGKATMGWTRSISRLRSTPHRIHRRRSRPDRA